jgi:divalent metal cation (Fe/Co/Zn/Cd) transporter
MLPVSSQATCLISQHEIHGDNRLVRVLLFDGLASVIIGLILLGTAVWLAYETKGLLIGESANKQVVQGVRNIIRANELVEHVNEVLTMHMGPDFVLANISVDFRDTSQVGELENVINRLSKEIKRQYPQIKRIFIEAEKQV